MVFGTTQRLNRNMTGFGPRFFDNSRFKTINVNSNVIVCKRYF